MDSDRSHPCTISLYSAEGERKYVNLSERRRIQEKARMLKLPHMLFVLVVLWTGARVSEALSLTASSFQLESGFVSIRTLKRRRPFVREIPLPGWLVAAIEQQFLISQRQRTLSLRDKRLWTFTRWTGWRLIKQVMIMADIPYPSRDALPDVAPIAEKYPPLR